MMRVPAPADKRFRRVRVVPSRRARWFDFSWRRLARAAAILAVVAFAVYRVATALFTASILTIARFEITGNTRVSSGQVIGLLDDLRGSNMLAVDLEPWRQKLLASPWIADATMRRVLPGTVSVAISERRPIGIGRVSDALYLVDDRGTIIDKFGPRYAEIDLPIINGLLTSPAQEELEIDQGRAGLAARVLSALRGHPSLADQVSEIDVTDVRDAVLLLKGDTTLVRIGDARFVERLQSYLDIAPVLRERVPSIGYVDLRFDERVYVKPQGPGGSRLVNGKVGEE